MTVGRTEDESDAIRQQLTAMGLERQRLEARLAELEQSYSQPSSQAAPAASVTNQSPASEKIAFFRRLFAGRTDVFPVR